jgi:photosystem II stability/assembly factor-like uncharacterized protein
VSRRHHLLAATLLAFALGVVGVASLADAASAHVDYGSVSFVDKEHGWVAGIDDETYMTEVWRTSGGGDTWTKIGSVIAAGAGVDWVAFANPSSGVWGNGSVWFTDDGGDAWRTALTGVGIFNQADFVTDDLAWAGYSYGTSQSGGGIAVTTDGGATWTRQLERPAPDGSGGFSRVSCPTATSCYVLKWGSKGGVYATRNGGAKWRLCLLPSFAAKFKFYRDIDYPAANTGWAVGDSGRIVRTTNAGASWRRQRAKTTASLLAVDFIDPQQGFIVGAGGLILRTVDGGEHWVHLSSGSGQRLTAVCFVDEAHGWVVGADDTLLRTTDGGDTWQALP